MARVETGYPDEMVFRSGGGCAAIFGVPILLIGLGILSLPFWAQEEKEKGELPPVAVLFFGLPFTLGGFALTFGRKGVIIDRRTRRVTEWKGALGLNRKKAHRIDAFDSVSLTRKVRMGNNNRRETFYPVGLAGSGKTAAIEIEKVAAYEAGQKLAEELAKFLDFKIIDTATSTRIVREAGTMDESLRDRIQREGTEVELSEQPADARLQYEVRGKEIQFEIPPTGYNKAHYTMIVVGLILPLAAGAFLTAMLLGKDAPEGVTRWLVSAFLAGAFILLAPAALVGGAIRTATKRVTVTVSPETLRVAEKAFLLDREYRIPADELEELRIGSASAIAGDNAFTVHDQRGRITTSLAQGKVILARSDRVMVTFGQGLSDEELRWLKAVIEKTLTV